MGGKCASNLISTTLPRTETTAPRFEGLVLFFMFALADPPSVYFSYTRLFPPALSLSTLRPGFTPSYESPACLGRAGRYTACARQVCPEPSASDRHPWAHSSP